MYDVITYQGPRYLLLAPTPAFPTRRTASTSIYLNRPICHAHRFFVVASLLPPRQFPVNAMLFASSRSHLFLSALHKRIYVLVWNNPIKMNKADKNRNQSSCNTWCLLDFKPKIIYVRAYLHTFIAAIIDNYLHSSIGSVNGLAPTRRQAFIWTNDG